MSLGHCVLITGASRGLGKSLVEHYLSIGSTVYGCSRNSSTIVHQKYRHFIVDISDERGVNDMFHEIATLKIELNLLINNAGVSQSSLGILTGSNAARQILEVNFLGTFFVIREALKLMCRQRYGRIINFSSINVPLKSAGSALYNGSKAGVEALCLSLVQECAQEDITINTIGLSLVEKSGMLDSLSSKALSEKQKKLVKPNFLNVEEIVNAINFFTSPLSKNITSQVLYFGGV
jgi:3-oxoacyl-[acyl-carrier protein] reductase